MRNLEPSRLLLVGLLALSLSIPMRAQEDPVDMEVQTDGSGVLDESAGLAMATDSINGLATATDFIVAMSQPEQGILLEGEPQLSVFSETGQFVVVSQRVFGPRGLYADIQVDTVGPPGSPSSRFFVGQSCFFNECPESPSVGASSSDGEFIILWNYEGGGYIQPSRFDGPFGDLADGPAKLDAVVRPFPNGEFLVVWERSNEIRAQRVASNGTELSSVFQVSSDTSNFQHKPSFAWNAVSEDFLVVWQSQIPGNPDGQGSSIQARRLASDGTPVGSDFQVNSYTTGSQSNPEVAAGPTGGSFIVVWDSYGSTGGDSDFFSIQGRQVDDETPLGSDFQINRYTTGSQRRPSVASELSSGTFLVSWRSQGSAGTDTDGSSIQAQRLDSNVARVGKEFQVNSYTPGDSFDVQVAASPGTEEFVVVWRTADTIRAARIATQTPLFSDNFESGDLSAWIVVQ